MKNRKLLMATAAILLAGTLTIISCSKKPKNNPAPVTAFDCSTMSAITTNTTYPAGTYTVSCDIEVSNSAVLTITPGTVLIFDQGISVTVDAGASITAAGTASLPIVFKGSQAIQGYWNGIFINSISLYNTFSYCTISDAGAVTGSYSFGANVTMDNATASFTNCTISNSKDAGIYMDNDVPDVTVFNTFTNNTITGNNSYPVITNAVGAGSVGTGNTYTTNSNNYIGIAAQGGYIGFAGVTVNVTLNPQPIPYLFLQTGSDEGVMFRKNLTIMPGTTIAMGSQISILIASTGSISAAGTTASPIVIKGLQATAGYWGSVFVQSNDATNAFQYCTVSDGGGPAPIVYYPNLGLISTYDGISESNSRTITVKNCTLGNSASSGIYLSKASTTYTVTYNPDIATSNTFLGCMPNVAL